MLLDTAQTAVRAALHAIPMNRRLDLRIAEVGNGTAAGILANHTLTLHAPPRSSAWPGQ
jgi:hypothetical protein